MATPPRWEPGPGARQPHDPDVPLLFACARDAAFAGAVAHHLGLSPSPLEERDFEDGEHKVRPLVDVGNCDVYVIAGLHGGADRSVHDCLCRLLFLIGCLKTNGARRITLVTPYLCYLRKDRQTKDRDPLTGRYVAQLLEAMGTDRIVVMEPHNPAALQNAFRIPAMTLNAYDKMSQYFAEQIGDAPVSVVSPDIGGAKRAELFRERLEHRIGRPVGKGLMEKHRSMGTVSGDLFAGDVKNSHVIIIDDLISSGGTVQRVARFCHTNGAKSVHVAATHGLFDEGAARNLADPAIASLLITNSVWPMRLSRDIADKSGVLDVSSQFAEAIAELAGFGPQRQRRDIPDLDAAPRHLHTGSHSGHTTGKVEITIPPDNVAGVLQVPPHLRGMVILATGSPAGRHGRENQYVADALVEDGFATLLVDLLPVDQLDVRKNITDINVLFARLTNVIDWVLSQPGFAAMPLGLVGAGIGCSAAFYAAADRPEIKALVAISAKADLASGILDQIKMPTRLIVGGLDRETLRLNEAALEKLGGLKSLEIVPMASHLFSEPGALDAMAALGREWFERYLKDHVSISDV